MSDYESICETIARNNLALDDRRYDDCLATYAPDGSIAGRTGHAAIREFMMSQDLAKRPELQRRHVNSNIVAEVGGDTAKVTSDLFVYDKVDGGAWTLAAVGRYQDRLARQAEGLWLFTSRELTFL
jgi:3-phenylpropionate/cinnamic acid dioxygenase small subunit